MMSYYTTFSIKITDKNNNKPFCIVELRVKKLVKLCFNEYDIIHKNTIQWKEE